jgi:hypothetical protein
MSDANTNHDLNFEIKMEQSNNDKKKVILDKKKKDPENINVSNVNNEDSNNKKEVIDFTNFLSHAHHPVVVVFSLIFKILAIVL